MSDAGVVSRLEKGTSESGDKGPMYREMLCLEENATSALLLFAAKIRIRFESSILRRCLDAWEHFQNRDGIGLLSMCMYTMNISSSMNYIWVLLHDWICFSNRSTLLSAGAPAHIVIGR